METSLHVLGLEVDIMECSGVQKWRLQMRFDL